MSDPWAAGTLVGTYVIEGEIGRGGLGRVLRANDRRFDRQVAIKVLIDPDPGAAQRFASEAKVTARLQHPSIIPVYEQGSAATGERFYVMKLVDGQTLAARIAACTSLEQRLALLPAMLQTARALAYAHETGWIHRDIKPANVLIGAFGEVVIADWGLCCALGASPGAIVGTPGYMAPEQARGESSDARADVYALGKTLWSVLAGSPSGPLPVGTPRDLVAIGQRATAEAPAERYPDAGAFALDLERFLGGRLIAARRYSLRERLARWFRRYRVAVIATLAMIAGVSSALAIAARRVATERDIADARAAALVLARARIALDRDPTEAVAWLKQYPAGGAQLAEARAIASEAEHRGVAREVYRHPQPTSVIRFSPDSNQLATACFDQLVRVFEHDRVRVLRGHGTWVDDVVYFSDGARLVSGGRDGRIAVWNLATATARISAPSSSRGTRTFGLAVIEGGTRIVSAHDAGLRTWDPDTLVATTMRDRACCLRFRAVEPDPTLGGATIATGSWGGLFAVFQGNLRLRSELGALGYQAELALSPDGRWVAGVRTGTPVTLWDLAMGDVRQIPISDSVSVIAFAPDARTLAVGTRGGVVLVDITTAAVHPIEAARPYTLAFSPDGHWLAIGFNSEEMVADEWKSQILLVDRRDLTRRVLARQGPINALAWSPDSSRLASASDDQVRVWEPDRIETDLARMTSAEISAGQLSSPVHEVGAIEAVPVTATP